MRTQMKQKHTRKRQDESEMTEVLCWSQSWETWALVFTTHLMLDKLISIFFHSVENQMDVKT